MMTTSAGATMVLNTLIEVGPLATTIAVRTMAKVPEASTSQPLGSVWCAETSPLRPSIERPNISPSTASQPMVRNTTAST
ncbi:hypothetical protein D3C86_1512060 [compost metagenome]